MPAAPSPPRGRKQVGSLAPWLLALLAAGLLAGIVASDRLLIARTDFTLGQPAPYTLRTSPLQASPLGAHGGAIIVARGQQVDAAQAQFAKTYRAPSSGQGAALFLVLFGLLLAWSSYLRSQHWSRSLRRQMVSLGGIVLLALAMRAVFLLSAVSVLAAPVAVVGLLLGRRSSRGAAVASGALFALLIAAMVPLDLGIVLALLLQATLPPLLLTRNAPLTKTFLTLLLAGIASALSYAVAYAAAWQSLPSLSDPLHSTWLAALMGALLSALLFLLLRPPFDWLCGEVSRRKLANLERLSQPLLRQIASQSPGTWQHSLAMAKLAEPASNAIGADTQLLRVGAYYHDLGKSLAPKYFNENLSGGENSVHEKLKPSASRDAIFAHVTEGMRAAREAGLPGRVIDFIASHHCVASLDYFWAMEQSLTQASNAKPREFCYPGTLPQCRETAILCICDAVESASRSLKTPSREAIEDLVHHIVYGKLRAGQLDESGLSLADTQAVDRCLVESLVLAHEPAAPRARGADAVPTSLERRKALEETQEKAAPRLAQLSRVRLDSLDRPSPDWQPQGKPGDSPFGGERDIAFVETEAMESTDNSEGETGKIDPGGSASDKKTSTSDVVKEEDIPTPTPRSTADFEAQRDRALQSHRSSDKKSPASQITDHLRTRERTAESPPEDRMTMPRKSMDSAIEERITEPRSAEDHAVQPAQAAETEHTDPVLLESPIRVDVAKKEAGAANSLDHWSEALGDARDDDEDTQEEPPGLPPPPPGSPSVPRQTIPLGGDENKLAPAPASKSRSSKRADSNDGLKPGEMVVGAPPSTHPERTLPGIMPRDEVTAEHSAVLPDEARRPEDRITEESPAVMPMDAYPETISAPGPVHPDPTDKDKR